MFVTVVGTAEPNLHPPSPTATSNTGLRSSSPAMAGAAASCRAPSGAAQSPPARGFAAVGSYRPTTARAIAADFSPTPSGHATSETICSRLRENRFSSAAGGLGTPGAVPDPAAASLVRPDSAAHRAAARSRAPSCRERPCTARTRCRIAAVSTFARSSNRSRPRPYQAWHPMPRRSLRRGRRGRLGVG